MLAPSRSVKSVTAHLLYACSYCPSCLPFICLPGRVPQCGQRGSEGGDVPLFNHPPLTDDEFHAPSLLPRGSQAAPEHYITRVWAGTRLVLFLGLLPVVHSIVLCCLWLIWCDQVWPLCTRGSRNSVGIISGLWNPWNSGDKKGIDDLLCKRCVWPVKLGVKKLPSHAIITCSSQCSLGLYAEVPWIYLPTLLYTHHEQPTVQVFLEIYLYCLRCQLTLSILFVCSPVGFILIGTQHKTWGRTSAGILTTTPVVRGATQQTPT